MVSHESLIGDLDFAVTVREARGKMFSVEHGTPSEAQTAAVHHAMVMQPLSQSHISLEQGNSSGTTHVCNVFKAIYHTTAERPRGLNCIFKANYISVKM
jgi:hypothetical protein